MSAAEDKSYIIRDFPQGYQLFDHNKGPKDDPRHDPYLYGLHTSSCEWSLQTVVAQVRHA